MAWVRAVALRELRPGAAKRVTVEGRTLALVSVNGGVHAIDDECPHDEGGSLSRGTVDDESIWCPLHGARFALVTGETLEPPEGEPMAAPVDRGVRSYPVSVIGDAVYVDL